MRLREAETITEKVVSFCNLRQVVRIPNQTLEEIFANTEVIALFHKSFAEKLEEFFLKWTPKSNLSVVLTPEVDFLYLC